jgi:hypothetical protein
MARVRFDAFAQWWLCRLRLQRQSSVSWHRDRIREELLERRQARHALLILSETCDILFSFARARHDVRGFRRWPRANEYRYMLPYTYMVLKYTSRYAFYRTVGVLSGSACAVREVVNPARERNLFEVAERNGIDRNRFRAIGRGLFRIWPLLP